MVCAAPDIFSKVDRTYPQVERNGVFCKNTWLKPFIRVKKPGFFNRSDRALVD